MESSNTVLDGGAIEAVAKLAIRGESIDVTEIGGRTFTDKPIHRVNVDPDLPKALSFFSLAALVAYLKADPAVTDALIHVVTPMRVEAIGELEGVDKHLRRVLAVAECPIGNPIGFKFNDAMPMEALNIALQTCFEPGVGDVEELRVFCGSVASTSEVRVSDDSVSQEVNAKAGLVALSSVKVKNPWSLAPFRTFSEVQQPTSPFVLRFFKGENGPRGGIFETGNAQWKTVAVTALAQWLRGALNGETDPAKWRVLG